MSARSAASSRARIIREARVHELALLARQLPLCAELRAVAAAQAVAAAAASPPPPPRGAFRVDLILASWQLLVAAGPQGRLQLAAEVRARVQRLLTPPARDG